MSDLPSSTPAGDASPPNKFFQKWRREFSLLTGLGIESGDRINTIDRRKCENWKRDLLNYSPAVVFMVKQLQLAGCNVTPEHLPCTPCDRSRSGGFASDIGAVVLCQGNYMDKKHMEHTMVHELVHMYDHTKFKVDWNNLRHHACSEIRAGSLSGDCTWRREIGRGFLSFTNQHQACVRRRAILSVSVNPACPDHATAERVVNEVWESCFNDTRPFDEIY